MKANEFYNSIDNMYLETTCVGGWERIEPILNKSVRANYNKIVLLIKKLMPGFYEDLALEFYNPWSNKTYRSKDGNYIIITHSMIEYLIKVN